MAGPSRYKISCLATEVHSGFSPFCPIRTNTMDNVKINHHVYRVITDGSKNFENFFPAYYLQLK